MAKKWQRKRAESFVPFLVDTHDPSIFFRESTSSLPPIFVLSRVSSCLRRDLNCLLLSLVKRKTKRRKVWMCFKNFENACVRVMARVGVTRRRRRRRRGGRKRKRRRWWRREEEEVAH